MFDIQDSDLISKGCPVLETSERAQSQAGLPAADLLEGAVAVVARGQSLFREGDPKDSAYAVESGIFCLTEQRPSGPPAVIATVFPGEFLGLGFLDRHIHSAIAVVQSTVTRVPLDTIPLMCELSGDVCGKQAAAVEQEFEARRRSLVTQTPVLPMVRVAAFLVAVAQSNAREGRDPAIVTQGMRSGEVAQLLGMEIDVLALALAALQARKLIERNPEGGLHILSVSDLDAVAMNA